MEVFEELSKELGLDSQKASTGKGVEKAVQDAVEGGLVGSKGQSGTVDVGVQPHRNAPAVRKGLDVTGAGAESAHIGPTSALRNIPGYSRGGALTTLLPPDVHAALDAYWKEWAKAMRRAGKTQCTGSALLGVMRNAINQIPKLSKKAKNTLAWLLELEFKKLGIGSETIIDLPYSNIGPGSAP